MALSTASERPPERIGLEIDLLLIGGGGHAKVVAEAASLGGIGRLGFLDDNPDAVLDGAARRLGRVGDFASALADCKTAACILGVGDLGLRRVLIGGLADWSSRLASVHHPRASVSPSAVCHAGVFVGPGAIVHTAAEIGAHAIINSGAIVEHDCAVGENTHVAPGAVIGGGVTVGRDSLIGLGSRVLPGARIGSGSIVGAGAVVTGDVADGATVVGSPAKPL